MTPRFLFRPAAVEILPGVRRAVIDRFPYGIFYRQLPDGIEVLAVFHHRRDPMIWRSRAEG